MHHCSTGPGAWNIGQVYPLDGSQNDTSHSVLLALVDWVENGTAPTSMIGTKYQNDDIHQDVVSQRSKNISLSCSPAI